MSLRPGRRGGTLIEFALVLTAFVMLLFGIIELGRAWFSYNLITHAVREATRQAAVRPGLVLDDSAIIGVIDDILGDGGLAATDTTVSFREPLETGRMVRVTSQVDFSPVISLWSPGGPLVFPLTVTMITRYEI
jgi:Flp pilus assembly protein TadG